MCSNQIERKVLGDLLFLGSSRWGAPGGPPTCFERYGNFRSVCFIGAPTPGLTALEASGYGSATVPPAQGSTLRFWPVWSYLVGTPSGHARAKPEDGRPTGGALRVGHFGLPVSRAASLASGATSGPSCHFCERAPTFGSAWRHGACPAWHDPIVHGIPASAAHCASLASVPCYGEFLAMERKRATEWRCCLVFRAPSTMPTD